MSIENGVATGAPKAAAQGVAGHGHRKGQAGAAAAGDFASLLTGLGAGGELVPDAGAAGTDKDALRVSSDTEKPDAAADAGMCGAGLPAAPVPTDPEPAVTAADARSGGLAALAALDGQARARPARGQTPGADAPHELTPPADAAGTAQEAGAQQAGSEVQPLLRQATLVQRMVQERKQTADKDVQAGKEQRNEDLAARLGARTGETQAPANGQSLAWLAAGTGENGLRPFERRPEKAGQRSAGVGDVGAWSGQPQVDGARLDVPAVAPDGGLTTEMRVAEQVSYWIGRGTQNAELEVEGLGEGPVKVSIALQGQEARVEFRADQAQTRQVLQDSMPHLRDLLEREGLVLSGLSVGSSGAEGGSGQPSSQERRGGRQGQATVELPVAALAARRGAPLSGGSVDLFV